MGYKKLDEVMELLTDELDGFNKALNKLQLLHLHQKVQHNLILIQP